MFRLKGCIREHEEHESLLGCDYGAGYKIRNAKKNYLLNQPKSSKCDFSKSWSLNPVALNISLYLYYSFLRQLAEYFLISIYGLKSNIYLIQITSMHQPKDAHTIKGHRFGS